MRYIDKHDLKIVLKFLWDALSNHLFLLGKEKAQGKK